MFCLPFVTSFAAGIVVGEGALEKLPDAPDGVTFVAGPATNETASAGRRRAFEAVYEEGRWFAGGDGALCKSGWSAVHAGQASGALDALEMVIAEHDICSIVDLPSGDGCFAEGMLARVRQSRLVEYVGVDIVADLVEANRQRLGDEHTTFVHADVTTLDHLLAPPRSIVFSRQMMQHMCNADVAKALDLISRSNAHFALLTTFKTAADFQNADIGCDTGGYRPQDLTKPPFSLPAPLHFFPERYPVDERVGLGLWKLPNLTRIVV